MRPDGRPRSLPPAAGYSRPTPQPSSSRSSTPARSCCCSRAHAAPAGGSRSTARSRPARPCRGGATEVREEAGAGLGCGRSASSMPRPSPTTPCHAHDQRHLPMATRRARQSGTTCREPRPLGDQPRDRVRAATPGAAARPAVAPAADDRPLPALAGGADVPLQPPLSETGWNKYDDAADALVPGVSPRRPAPARAPARRRAATPRRAAARS